MWGFKICYKRCMWNGRIQPVKAERWRCSPIPLRCSSAWYIPVQNWLLAKLFLKNPSRISYLCSSHYNIVDSEPALWKNKYALCNITSLYHGQGIESGVTYTEYRVNGYKPQTNVKYSKENCLSNNEQVKLFWIVDTSAQSLREVADCSKCCITFHNVSKASFIFKTVPDADKYTEHKMWVSLLYSYCSKRLLLRQISNKLHSRSTCDH
jgi:hypothetical protein